MTFARIPFNSNDAASNLTSDADLGFDSATNTLLVGSTPTGNASVALRIVSTTQALGLSSMTTAQKNAISTPVTGALVYDTDEGDISFYNGAAWVEPSTGTGFTSYTVSTDWTGIWAGTQTQNVYGQKFGDQVTLTFVAVSATANTAAQITNTSTPLDAAIRPLRNLTLPFVCTDNGVLVKGSIEITTAGVITISPDSTGMIRVNLDANFTASGNGGFPAQGISYLVV